MEKVELPRKEPKKWYVGHYELEYRSRRLAQSIFRHDAVQRHMSGLVKEFNALKKRQEKPGWRLFSRKILSDKDLLNLAVKKVGRLHVIGLNRGGVEISKFSVDELTYQISNELKFRTGLPLKYEVNHAVTSVGGNKFGQSVLSPTVAVDGVVTAKIPFSKVGKKDTLVFVDDLVDEGRSFKAVRDFFGRKYRSCGILTAALFAKAKRKFSPDIFDEAISDAWVVFPSEKREHGWAIGREFLEREAKFAGKLKEMIDSGR